MIYSLAVTSFGLAESFCRGFDYFPWKMIQSGDFDRLLLRPRSLFIQVAGSYFHIHRLPRVLTGICVIIWAVYRLHIPFSILNLTILLLALIGGFLTYMPATMLHGAPLIICLKYFGVFLLSLCRCLLSVIILPQQSADGASP